MDPGVSLSLKLKLKSGLSSSGEGSIYGDAKKDSRPFFRTNATLAIPNIVMQPALDEVQQGLNKAVQSIISCSKGVAQWSKERKRVVKVSPRWCHL